jgi:hypothetical protein
MTSTILFVIACALQLPQVLIYIVWMVAPIEKRKEADIGALKDLSVPSAMFFLAAVVAKFIGLP